MIARCRAKTTQQRCRYRQESFRESAQHLSALLVAHACGKLLMARMTAQVPALGRLKCKVLTVLDAPPRPLSRPAPSIMCKAPSLPSLSAGALGVPSSEVVPPA